MVVHSAPLIASLLLYQERRRPTCTIRSHRLRPCSSNGACVRRARRSPHCRNRGAPGSASTCVVVNQVSQRSRAASPWCLSPPIMGKLPAFAACGLVDTDKRASSTPLQQTESRHQCTCVAAFCFTPTRWAAGLIPQVTAGGAHRFHRLLSARGMISPRKLSDSERTSGPVAPADANGLTDRARPPGSGRAVPCAQETQGRRAPDISRCRPRANTRFGCVAEGNNMQCQTCLRDNNCGTSSGLGEKWP